MVKTSTLTLALVVLTLLSMLTFLSAAEPLKPALDEAAINFSLLDLANQKVSLSDFKNKPVILFFWTTWCPYCRNELKTLKNNYAGLVKDGISLLAIDVGESSSKVDNFIRNYSLPFSVLLDTDTQVAISYKILGVPTYIFIDKKGRIISKENYFSPEIKKRLLSE